MKTQHVIAAAKLFLPLLCVMNLLLFLCPVQAQADLPGIREYCNVPPLPGSGVKSNLLLMIDNSASMYDLAYTDPSKYCIDDSTETFDKAGSQYVGYFDQDTLYRYDFANRHFVRASAGQTISSSSCNKARTGYVCVNIASGSVDNFLATGKFLNWLTMSKLDIEKLALTGGKLVDGGASYPKGLLQAESRGCQGKRFLKILGEIYPVTFAVRGPIPSESDYSQQASQGGMTRIEIYANRYRKDQCLAAVRAWQTGTKETLQAAAASCLGNEWEDPETMSIASKGKVYSLIMSDCYTYLAGQDITTADPALVGACFQRYRGVYGDDPLAIPSRVGDDVCGGGLYHDPIVHGSIVNTWGYLGQCQWADAGDWDDPCIVRQMKDFCNGIVNPWLRDPSTTAYKDGTDANVPEFILEAGISSLGEVSGTLVARLAPTARPAGLIQEFSGDINFSAMIFNDNGAGSECGKVAGVPCIKYCRSVSDPRVPDSECYRDSDCKSGGTCQPAPLTDGGRIISYPDPSGETSGIVSSINAVSAHSWTPLAESFYNAIGYFANRTDLRLQSADFVGLSSFSCQRNNILIVSDGISSADRNTAVYKLMTEAGNLPPSSITTGSEALPALRGSYNLDDLAWIARNKNITDFTRPITANRDFISTYVVYTGAPTPAGAGYNADGSLDEGVPEKMMQLVASKGGGSFASAQHPNELKGALRNMFHMIGTETNSGTDASILSTGDGNGAIYLQEQFHPVKSFDGGATSVSWIGEMKSLWYYIDPFLDSRAGAASAIREDSVADPLPESEADPTLKLKLNLKSDKIVSLRLDEQSYRTYAYLTADSDGDGIGDGSETRVEVDQLKNLWRAGRELWARDLTASPRTIYTPLLNGGTEWERSGLMKFSYTSPDAVAPYLNLQTGDPDASQLMKYIHGFDFAPNAQRRNRTLRTGSLPLSSTDPQEKGVAVWKLGDIVSSTAQVQSSAPVGSYHLASPGGYGDASYLSFITSTDYKRRGMVYVGANDGMLHAFRLGKVETSSTNLKNADGSLPEDLKAALTGSELGREEWGFIPKNALPYLKHLADPDYRHLYYVDGGITLVDASIGDTNSGACVKAGYWNCVKPASVQKSSSDKSLDPAANIWRTVLIGGMGLGGASGASCDAVLPEERGTAKAACVPTPAADPADSSRRIGYSSYFALDVTDPGNPALLWEFSDPALGYSTTGPAIVRIGSPELNGRWFAVFGSGPTGPIESSSHQFLGRSSQPLRFFVVDLRSGALLKTIETDIDYAFAGSMLGGGIDADRWRPYSSALNPGNYQDDALYAGYTKKASASDVWTDGGVLRIITHESIDPNDSVKPWSWSRVIDGIGPVTSGISRLQDRKNHKLWLYFGTGRYFYSADDPGSQRHLFGVQDRCYTTKDTLDRECATRVKPEGNPEATGKGGALGLGDLKDQTTDIATSVTGKGWYIRLDKDTVTGTAAERSITDPVAASSGAVFFTTFQPSTDPCQLGGSYQWGVRYDTAEAIPAGWIYGKTLVQLSNGGLQEATLGRGGEPRRGPKMPGRGSKTKVVSNSGLRPLKKIIHMQER